MFERLTDRLDRAVAQGGYLGGGLCRIDAAGRQEAHVTGWTAPSDAAGRERLSDPGVRMRMASISKAATGRLACELACAGQVDLDAEVADLAGGSAVPALLRGVTLRMLLNHTSGLTDAAGYLFASPLGPVDFIAAHADKIGSGRAPGTWFRYCNLNYVLLAALLETATGRRFDLLVREAVLAPAGIGGGFNWSGVAPSARRRHLQIYQRLGGRLERQTEPPGSDWAADIVLGDGRGRSFASYVPGRDTVSLSPHAGLRMSVIEAARLARLLGEDCAAGRLQRRTSWKYQPAAPNGNACGGLFGEFGLGVTLFRDETRIPGPLVGHAGHALGFSGGAWFNEATQEAFGLFLTGSADLTEGQDNEVFFAPAELSILERL